MSTRIGQKRFIELWVFCAAFMVGIAFALYTDRAWEDWFITYRASKNLAAGYGLVYTIGERVHSFTSPLGTLIPALFAYLTHNSSDALVLWLYRVFGCLLLGASALLLLRTARESLLGKWATVVLVGMFVLDAKIVDFSTNGQEVALMMLFLSLVLWLLHATGRNFSLKLGAVCAGLMWTRPDAFVYFGGLLAGYLLFLPASPQYGSRRELLRKILAAAGVAALLYLPWFAWSWSYYGTPIPHTVIAKGLFPLHYHDRIVDFLTAPLLHGRADPAWFDDTFMPPYWYLGGWGGRAYYIGEVLAIIAACYWFLPGGRRAGRAVSFAVFIGQFYLAVISPVIWPWYIPNVTLMSIFVLAQVCQQASDGLMRGGGSVARKVNRYAVSVLPAFSCALLATSLILTACSAYSTKLQQEIIENGNTVRIGQWLNTHASSPRDTVFVERLGYIGYYSQLKMYDWPGLSSPEVVAARRKLGTDDFAALIAELKPDWLVLRPREMARVDASNPAILSEYGGVVEPGKMYRPMEVFDVKNRIDAVEFLPGRPNLRSDQVFIVFRKN